MSCTPGARTSPTNPRSSAGPTHADARTRELTSYHAFYAAGIVRWLRNASTARTRRWSSSSPPIPSLARMLAMCLDGPFGQPEPARDAAVGAALRHEREHLALPWGKRGQLIGRAERAQEQRDDLRVECRSAVRDAAERVEEVVDVEDAVFEQIAEASGADELDRVLRLDVLGEQHDPEFGVPLSDLARGAR